MGTWIDPACDDGPVELDALDKFRDALKKRGVVCGTEAYRWAMVGWEAAMDSLEVE